MDTRICCAYNVSKGRHLSPKVTLVDRPDQPLTLMRLLVESLGFKAQTALWLSPLNGPPQLVRPFPFDLIYLDQDLRVITAVELLPEVPFPKFVDQVASALILPVRTISGSATEEGDELIICGKEELEFRLAEMMTPAVVSTGADDESASGRIPAASVPVLLTGATGSAGNPAAAMNAGPVTPFLTPAPKPSSEPAFAQVRTSGVTQSSAFTVGVTTTWQLTNSTFEAVLTAGTEVESEAETTQASRTDSVNPLEVIATEESGEETKIKRVEPAEDVLTAQIEARPNQVSPDLRLIDADRKAGSGDSVPHRSSLPPEPETNERSTELTAILGAFDVQEHPVEQVVSEASAEPAVTGTASKSVPKSTNTKPKTSSRQSTALDVQVAAAPAPKSAIRNTQREAPPIAPKNSAEESKAKSTDKRKKSLGFLVKEFLNCPDPLPENRLSARLVQQGIVAYHRPNDPSTVMQVRDVSSTGFYLRTKNRWQPGHVVTLRLERSGAREDEFQSRVNIQAVAVRCDAEGVGLKWVFPDGVKFEPWDRLHTKRSDESDLQYFIRELRLVKAQGFLQRISPLAKSEIRHALHERLSNKRVASAVEIALQAEDVLSRNGVSGKLLAHSDVVMRIVEGGSWIEDNWIRTMWAGLLVSACTADGQDTSNMTFIDLLARQTPVHLRILSHVCRKVEEAVAAGASSKSVDVYCTAQELTDAADSHSLARIHQTVGQLATSGLIVESARPSYATVLDKEKTRCTPTPLGFAMYTRCNGRRA